MFLAVITVELILAWVFLVVGWPWGVFRARLCFLVLGVFALVLAVAV